MLTGASANDCHRIAFPYRTYYSFSSPTEASKGAEWQ